MRKAMTQEQKLAYMTETSLPRLVFALAVPSIVSMMITAFYNMADTYFVGLIGSPSATGAIGVVFPLMSIMQAVAFMFGHGSGNHMSRALGAGDTGDAEKMAATGFFSAFAAGCVIMLVGFLFPAMLAKLLGATETIAPYAKEYMFYLAPGAPFLISSFVLNNQLRFQGSAFYGMIGMTAGTVLNIVLDPLLIFTFDMGVAGAALATSLGQFVSFLTLLLMTRQGGNIRIRFAAFTPSVANYKEIFRGGVPSLARQGLASLATICLNTAAGGFGDTAVAAMSIVTRIIQTCGSAVIGFGQGFQPVCGFNYGAKRYDRVREAFWFCVKICAGLLVVVAGLAALFAPQLVSLFLKDNPEVQTIGALSLRLQCITYPLFAFVIMANMMLQTIGMAGKATLLAVARQGLFLIPLVLLLPRAMGLLGVQLSQPISDVCSFLLAAPITLKVLNEFKQKA